MIDKELCFQVADLDFRVSKCIVIAAERSDSLTNNCIEIFEDYPRTIFDLIPNVHSDFTDDSYMLDGEFIEWLQLNERFGYLIEIDMPVPSRTKDGGTSLSWCYYTSDLVYGKTIDEALENAVRVAARYRKGIRGSNDDEQNPIQKKAG